MNSAWSDFLQSHPETSAYGDGDCILNDLAHYGLIRVSGEDAMAFLQGQLTNDMRQVNEDHSNLAGWCNAKGRALAVFRVFRLAEDYYLQVPAWQIESLIKRLRMFVLMSKVVVEDASEQLARFAISGKCAQEALVDYFGSLPASVNQVARKDDSILIRLPGAGDRFELMGPSETLQTIWQNIDSSAVRTDEDYWALQEIRAGIPTLFPQTTEAFVPQMMNLHVIDGISFTKGCYTGQEVVARMKYLGKLKRRMYLAHVTTEQPPQPGDELFATGSTSGQGTGKVVDARAADGGFDLLAVIETASVENGEVSLGENGAVLDIRNLPYTIEEDNTHD
jgi:folate-binding protein YgfZ